MKKIFSISLLDLPSSFFAQATKIKIDVDRTIIAMFEEKKNYSETIHSIGWSYVDELQIVFSDYTSGNFSLTYVNN